MTDENTSGDNGKLLYCSFCGKSQNEVRKLIAGPSVFICDECVDLCNDIIREEIQEAGTEGENAKLPIPAEINEILNQYVIGQQKAKRVLAVAVYNHYKRLLNTLTRDVSRYRGVIRLPGNLVDFINVNDPHLGAIHIIVALLEQLLDDIFNIFPDIPRFS